MNDLMWGPNRWWLEFENEYCLGDRIDKWAAWASWMLQYECSQIVYWVTMKNKIVYNSKIITVKSNKLVHYETYKQNTKTKLLRSLLEHCVPGCGIDVTAVWRLRTPAPASSTSAASISPPM